MPKKTFNTANCCLPFTSSLPHRKRAPFLLQMKLLENILSTLCLVNLTVFMQVCKGNDDDHIGSFLYNGYNPRARPVRQDKEAVNIQVDITLLNVMKVNEKDEVLQTGTWIKLYWNDPRLVWNMTHGHFKGIQQITLEPKGLWLPDISLLNSATANTGVTGAECRVILKHTGDIAWLNPAIVKSSCSIDITNFPFDDQICELRLGSWSYSLPSMDIMPIGKTADLSLYVENGEWILQSAIPHRKIKEYECCNGSYPEVTYELRLRRRTFYYMVNFIFPCVLIAFLTLLVFLLPFESGERMSFGVTVLLSFTILILMLMNKLPATSKAIPLIGIYYACTIIEVSLAMFSACLIMRVCYPENPSSPLPRWAKVIITKYCARIVGLRKPVERVKQERVIQALREEKLGEHKSNSQMNILTEDLLKKENAEIVGEEWSLYSVILNRVFALIYLVTIIVTLLAVLMRI